MTTGKKLVLLVLALVIITSVIAGCGCDPLPRRYSCTVWDCDEDTGKCVCVACKPPNDHNVKDGRFGGLDGLANPFD